MKIIVLGLIHTKTVDPAKNSPFSDCAFTMKVWNLCRMMTEQGHEVVHLGTEGSAPICTRNIDVMSNARWEPIFGKRNANGFFNTDVPNEYAAEYGVNVRAAIKSLGWEDHTAIMCLTWGGDQIWAVQGVPQFAVASGIGHFSPFGNYRVYESYALLHAMIAKEEKLTTPMWYHVVIPNGLDPDLFGPVVPTAQKQPYVMFMGRMIETKGIRIACGAAKAAGLHIKVVGPGDPSPFRDAHPEAEFLPPANAEQRRELMRNAQAFICPTYYLEPFGNVAVEAMLSGCPVVTTDWGVFTETVPHGKTGYRCRTRDHFIWSLKNIHKIDPNVCRRWAMANYSLDAVGPRYTEFFQQVLNLKHEGWESVDPTRTQLDWLNAKPETLLPIPFEIPPG